MLRFFLLFELLIMPLVLFKFLESDGSFSLSNFFELCFPSFFLLLNHLRLEFFFFFLEQWFFPSVLLQKIDVLPFPFLLFFFFGHFFFPAFLIPFFERLMFLFSHLFFKLLVLHGTFYLQGFHLSLFFDSLESDLLLLFIYLFDELLSFLCAFAQ